MTKAERAVPSECTKAVCLACARVSCFQKNAFTLSRQSVEPHCATSAKG